MNNMRIPDIFLGTAPFAEMGDYTFKRLRTVRAVGEGIRLGYGIDCAVAYGNHHQVGNGIKLSQKKRKQIFLTSKLYNTQQDHCIHRHYDDMLKELEVDYLDLLLLHWPQTTTYIDSWKQMEQLYNNKKVHYIGIANVELRHLLEMENKCDILPHVIQIERNPFNVQEELISYCLQKGIKVQAYAPIGRMNEQLINQDILKKLAHKYRKTIPQIILRWHYQTDVIPVVRSIRINRIRENYNIWDFQLCDDEIKQIMMLNKNYKIYDPRRYVKYY